MKPRRIYIAQVEQYGISPVWILRYEDDDSKIAEFCNQQDAIDFKNFKYSK